MKWKIWLGSAKFRWKKTAVARQKRQNIVAAMRV
jgi:hypothetical protein